MRELTVRVLAGVLLALLLGGAAPASAASLAPPGAQPDGVTATAPGASTPATATATPTGTGTGTGTATSTSTPTSTATATATGTATGTAPGTATDPAADPPVTPTGTPTDDAPVEGPAASEPEPTVAPTAAPETGTAPSATAEATAPAPTPARLSPSSPALSRSSIPLSSVALAVVVLLVGGLLVRTAVRRGPAVTPAATTSSVGPVPAHPPGVGPGAPDPATLDFLLALGEALVDTGDAINHVQEVLEEVATVNGVHGVAVVVMPTALFISLPHQDGVQTEVSAAGSQALRLDQVDEVFRIVARARRGTLSPSDGRVELARVRATGPRFSAAQQLLGYVLFTLGLVLILRGGGLELLVGGGAGLLVGALHLASERFRAGYRPFLPVVGAFGASVLVLGVARVLPELAVFPPLVAALVAFLPGALLTTAVLELSTGQIMSGSGRLAAGALRLVLLALGILAGAQLVGLPGAAIDNPAGGAAVVAATWTGVAVFGVGVVLFKGARWSSLPWILLVLYVAYAGQVLGGLLFGGSLSAFFGALAMTPVAMVAARQESGPPALVSFLPGFWLLVPGAVGLEGVTRFLDEDTAAGVTSLVTIGTSMVGIALGVLLGLAVGGQVADRRRRTSTAGDPAPDDALGPR